MVHEGLTLAAFAKIAKEKRFLRVGLCSSRDAGWTWDLDIAMPSGAATIEATDTDILKALGAVLDAAGRLA